MLDDIQLIEKAIKEFGDESIITHSHITESSDHTKYVILKNNDEVSGVYQIMDNDTLLRLDKLPPDIENF